MTLTRRLAVVDADVVLAAGPHGHADLSAGRGIGFEHGDPMPADRGDAGGLEIPLDEIVKRLEAVATSEDGRYAFDS